MFTILIIEDSDYLRADIAEVLLLEGFNPLQAEDGLKGVDLAREHHPDLILCDINLPLLNGFGVAEALKGNVDTENIPFLLMTAATDLKSLPKEFDGRVLIKPFELSALLKIVKQYIP
ncbi:MAG: response regulator [Chitinophagaceae bacterium]|nr:response regulator [Anaerolineae bacterium]